MSIISNIFSGHRENYTWFEFRDPGITIRKLIQAIPEIVLNKYLVNTSFDSGALGLSPEERNQGWEQKGELTYSPKITSIDQVSYYEFDEWYIFPSSISPNPATYDVFVNDSDFSLQEPSSHSQGRFWQQLLTIKPESYLAEGNYLILVTMNPEVIPRCVAITIEQ